MLTEIYIWQLCDFQPAQQGIRHMRAGLEHCWDILAFTVATSYPAGNNALTRSGEPAVFVALRLLHGSHL
jgi:hypothetical protein